MPREKVARCHDALAFRLDCENAQNPTVTSGDEKVTVRFDDAAAGFVGDFVGELRPVNEITIPFEEG